MKYSYLCQSCQFSEVMPLGGLIQEADTGCLVSPDAVKSERCAWEVDKTVALSKRLSGAHHCAENGLK
jgi:hypothetical protein